MIPTAEEFVLELEPEEGQNNFKLGTVVELFDNKTAKIKFDGEDAPSEKQYAYLESYKPEKDNRVLLASLGGTYVILGKVNYNVSPPEEIEIDRYVFDQKTVSILKGLQVSGAVIFNNGVVTFNNGMTVVGDIGVNGNVTATGLSASGAVTGASLNVSGQVRGNSLNITNPITVEGLTSNGPLYADGNFMHRGSRLSFFGQSSVSSRQTVFRSSGTPTVENLQIKINELISALQSYNLIG